MFTMKNKKSDFRRRGSMAVLVALLLTALIGATAFAIDGGMLQQNKRRAQATSDAAAMAAASTLYKNYPKIVSTGTADPSGAAKTAALAYAAANGFAHDGTTTVVSVSIPPATGPFTGKTGYAEVVITYHQPRYFSTVFGSGTIPVVARSVAIGKSAGSGYGVIVLDPTVAHALDANGTGAMNLTGGAKFLVDSNNTEAARTSGGGSLTAPEFDITGGTVGTFNGTVVTGTLPIPDPLAYLPVPPVPPDGKMVTTSLKSGNKQYTLSPGRYKSLPSFQQGDVVMLQQASANGNGGIFYLDGGGFSSQGANIIMDPLTSGGVMIYNNPSSQSNSQGINITGNASGTVNLSPLTSGPYAGILFWQNRTATQTMTVQGSGSFTLTGTFYTANALLSVSGGGIGSIGSQYVTRTLNISGGGDVNIVYSDQATARVREVYLVE